MKTIDLADLVLRWGASEGHSYACEIDMDPTHPNFRCDFCELEAELESAARALRLARKDTR